MITSGPPLTRCVRVSSRRSHRRRRRRRRRRRCAPPSFGPWGGARRAVSGTVACRMAVSQRRVFERASRDFMSDPPHVCRLHRARSGSFPSCRIRSRDLAQSRCWEEKENSQH
ncbi:hypothetical protein LX36DRAFT_57031 [Colletotrichum falcatum]|nr:hypothetical protein LX36DRAFT_57031 [Colletotrichum falcatum]